MSDRIFGGVGLALSLFFIWQATRIELSFISDPVGPRIFPIVIGVLMALASMFVIIKPDAAPQWPKLAQFFEIAVSVAVMVAYAILLPQLGFLISTAMAAAFLTWRLGTTPTWSLVTGLLTSVGIYTIFHLILGLSLARGPLGF